MPCFIVPNSRLSKIREASLPINGGRLFNELPKDIRNLTNVSLETFKRAVDQFLKTIPVEPQIATQRNNGQAQIHYCIWSMLPENPVRLLFSV